MKKLLSLYETVSKVNPALYTNLLFPTGVTAGASPSNDSINQNLLKDINTAAKAAGLKVSITTAVSGHKETTKSGTKSRHSTGNAVDIAMINGVAITKATGDKLVEELKKLGYTTSGSESGKDKVILWQVADHFNHIHVSNNSEVPSSYGDTTTEPSQTPYQDNSIDDDYTSVARNLVRNFVEPIADKLVNPIQNEEISPKEKKLIRDIEKIKKLL